MNSTLPATVTFDDQSLTVIEHDGQPYLPAGELARALGYSGTSAVTRIYRRNRSEFTDAMTLSVKLTGRGQVAPTPTRIFSPRGCHLVAMFSRTDRAAAFRRWVLDVLEDLARPTVAAYSEPPRVDLHTGITQAGADPVRLPDTVAAALDQRAMTLTVEAFGLIRHYLARRIAGSCVHGTPRRVHTVDALDEIALTTLSHALAPTAHAALSEILRIADAHADITAAHRNTLRHQLQGDPEDPS